MEAGEEKEGGEAVDGTGEEEEGESGDDEGEASGWFDGTAGLLLLLGAI